MSEELQHLLARSSADPHAVIAEVTAASAGDPVPDRIRDLLALGVAHRALLQPNVALSCLEEAMSLLVDAEPDDDLRWSVNAELAACRIDRGQPEDGLALLSSDPEPCCSPAVRGRVEHIRGLAHQRQGASEPSTRHYLTAMGLYATTDNQLGIGQVRTNLAILAAHDGRIGDALAELDRATEAFAAIDHDIWLAITVLNRGWVVGVGGNLPRSLQLLGEAEDLLLKLDLPDGLRLVSRAEVLLQAGLYGQARSELDAAIDLFTEQGLAIDRSEAMILAAHAAELDQDLDGALDLARRAVAELGDQVRPGWVAAARAAAFGLACRTGRATDVDLSEATDLAADLVSAGYQRLVPMVWLSSAWANLNRQRPGIARGDLDQVDAAPLSAEAASFLALIEARLLESEGDRERALRVLDRAYRDLEADLRLLGGIDVAAVAAESVTRIIATAKRLTAASDDSAAFLRWSDRDRQVATWRWPRLESPELAVLLNQARALTSGSATDPETATALEAIKSRIRELRWQAEGDRSRPVVREPLVSVAADLPTDAADDARPEAFVLDLTRAGDQWYVSWIDSQSTAPHVGHEAFHLDNADLTAAVRLSRLFQTSSPTVQQSLLEHLLANLDPLATMIENHLPSDQGRLIYLSIDEDLADIPWPVLAPLWSRPYSVLPTRRHLAAPAERVSTHPGASLLVGPGLATAGAEVTGLVGDPSRPVVTPGQSSFDELRNALDRQIVYIAAHGGPEPDNPLFNWLEFGCGRVFLHDLMFFDRVPESVVLAACYAGKSQRFGAGGTASFANGFLGVGSRWVVAASTALADDDALITFAADVLARMLADQSPPRALAAARRSAGDRRDNAAALTFTCYGG